MTRVGDKIDVDVLKEKETKAGKNLHAGISIYLNIYGMKRLLAKFVGHYKTVIIQSIRYHKNHK